MKTEAQGRRQKHQQLIRVSTLRFSLCSQVKDHLGDREITDEAFGSKSDMI